MVADGIGNERIRPFEVRVLSLRQQLVVPVVGDQHAFGSEEQYGTAPLRNLPFLHQFGIRPAVVPMQSHGWQVAARRILLLRDRPPRCAFRMHGSARFDRRRVPELERPEREIAVMAEEVAQLAIGEVPPIPPVERRIVRVIRSIGRRPQPQIPVQGGGTGG